MSESKNIIEYLEGEKMINEDSLMAFEPSLIASDEEKEIKLMRERESLILRQKIYDLRRHIEVIKRMYPNA